jgi:hypothetical protein
MTSSGDFSDGSIAPLTTKTCEICVNLRKMFTDSEYKHNQGLFHEILGKSCPGHDSLLHFISEKLSDDPDRSGIESWTMRLNGAEK